MSIVVQIPVESVTYLIIHFILFLQYNLPHSDLPDTKVGSDFFLLGQISEVYISN